MRLNNFIFECCLNITLILRDSHVRRKEEVLGAILCQYTKGPVCKSLALAFCGILEMYKSSDSCLHQGFGIITITVLFFKLTLGRPPGWLCICGIPFLSSEFKISVLNILPLFKALEIVHMHRRVCSRDTLCLFDHQRVRSRVPRILFVCVGCLESR